MAHRHRVSGTMNFSTVASCGTRSVNEFVQNTEKMQTIYALSLFFSLCVWVKCISDSSYYKSVEFAFLVV